MIIRLADVKDAKGIARVQVESWHTTYPGIVPKSYLDSLDVKKREKYGNRQHKTSRFMWRSWKVTSSVLPSAVRTEIRIHIRNTTENCMRYIL